MKKQFLRINTFIFVCALVMAFTITTQALEPDNVVYADQPRDIFTMRIGEIHDCLITNDNKCIVSYELPSYGDIKMSGCIFHTKPGINILSGAMGIDADYVQYYLLSTQTQSGYGTYDSTSVNSLVSGLKYHGIVQNLNHEGYAHDGNVTFTWYGWA